MDTNRPAIGMWVAWTVSAVALIYVAVMALGFIAAGGLDAPLEDPVLASMELLSWCRHL